MIATSFKLAQLSDLQPVMAVIQSARAYLKSAGSQQWQSGYPNEQLIKDDIVQGHCYVLQIENQIVGSCAFIPRKDVKYNYSEISQGEWIVDTENFYAVERLAIKSEYRGKGLGLKMISLLDEVGKQKQIKSIRGATFQQNTLVLHLFNKQGYKTCGLIALQPGERRWAVFEKQI